MSARDDDLSTSTAVLLLIALVVVCASIGVGLLVAGVCA